jgi:endoglucanase
LNVSNFQPTPAETAYGQALGRQLDGKHFVIDTSRNGNGAYRNKVHPDYGWCNPPERALGNHPALLSGTQDLLDAYLFIKAPGESDGQDADPAKCFGGLPAGQWMPEYAVGLVNRWPNNLQAR